MYNYSKVCAKEHIVSVKTAGSEVCVLSTLFLVKHNAVKFYIHIFSMVHAAESHLSSLCLQSH